MIQQRVHVKREAMEGDVNSNIGNYGEKLVQVALAV